MSLTGDNGLSDAERITFDVFSVIGIITVTLIALKLLWMVCRIIYYHDISKLCKTNLKGKYGGWAVVTGSTDGIGKAYAHELAARGFNIVLISRTLVKLDKVAQEIRAKHNVEVEVIQADFSNGRTIYAHIADSLSDKDVGILVNNVGVLAVPTKFENITEDEIWNQVIVNVASVPAMCKMVLPGMLARKRGLIVNVASSAAVAPLSLFQVYAATKAFVRSFSKSLEFEYRRTGLDVQTVLPGAVATNMTAWSKIISKPSLGVPTADKFARHAVATIGYASETAGYWNHELQMLKLLLIVLVSVVVWGSQEVRLAPGVVVEEDHQVWLASDRVTISVEFDNLGSARKELNDSKDRLHQMKRTLGEIESKRTLSVSLTRLMKEVRITLDRVDKGIDKTLEWIPDITPGNSLSVEKSRRKRAAPLVIGVGMIAAIGAMSITSLVKVAEVEKELSAQGKQLNHLQESNEKLKNGFETVRQSLNELSITVEGLREDLNATIAFFTIQHTLLNIEKEADSVRIEVQTQIKAIVAAADGHVYGDVLPLGSLENVLRNSAYLHGAKVLFSGKDLYLYYNVLSVRLSDRGLLIYVPVSTMKPFLSFVIRPFPSAFGDSVVMWDGVETMFILGDQYQGSGIDYKTGCTLVREKYVCDSGIFQLRVVSVGGCELSLVHGQTPTECDFRQFLRDYHIESTSTLTAIFCKECAVTMMCQSNKSTSFVLRGSKLFDSSCRILSTEFLVLSRAVFNGSVKIIMRHTHNEHLVVEVPTTKVPMTVPPLEDIDDSVMFEYQEYIMPTILIVLIAILLIILVVGVVKLIRVCKITCKGSKNSTPVTLEVRHESSP